MGRYAKENHVFVLLITAMLGWLVPGGGHFFLKEKKRSIIIFAAIVATFGVGLYIGSIGIVDTVGATPWYVYIAQIMSSPLVAVLAHITAGGGFLVYGRPNEIGQIYTSTAGLLNLLCIVNAVYLAHLRGTKEGGV